MHIEEKIHQFWARLPMTNWGEKIEGKHNQIPKNILQASDATHYTLYFGIFFSINYMSYIKEQREYNTTVPETVKISPLKIIRYAT
jgi:hypothetical protein